jgi:hypothetical protein
MLAYQATVEKILKVLTVDSKDVRKADWNNKEVGDVSSSCRRILAFHDEKEHICSINPARRGGSNAPISFEIPFYF